MHLSPVLLRVCWWPLVVLLVVVVSASAYAEPPLAAEPPLPSLLRLTSAPPYGVMRGDWEAPDVLVVAYDSDWLPSLEKMIRTARSEVEVLLLGTLDGEPELVSEWEQSIGDWAQYVQTPLLPFTVDTPWIRDYAPLQRRALDGTVSWLDFDYGADRPLDDAFPTSFSSVFGLTQSTFAIPLDGGAVVANGSGLCAITERSLLETMVDVDDPYQQHYFLEQLGCQFLAVVPALPDEETGHVDMFVQFTSPDHLLVASISPRRNRQAASVFETAVTRLREAARVAGLSLTIERVPMVIRGDKHYSYINGTRLRSSYLVPSYENVSARVEEAAYAAMARSMPGVRLVPIRADAMIERHGAVHCLTAGLAWPKVQKPRVARRPKHAPRHRIPRRG